MNAQSKPGPAGENSRRDFIQRIGAVAAASTVAASASAQQPPPAGASGPGPAPPVPGSLSKEPMPMVRFGKYNISRLIIGVNPPGSHFSARLVQDAAAWNTPERRVQQFKRCEELGINTRVQTRDQIQIHNRENGGKLMGCGSEGADIGRDGNWEATEKAIKAHVGYGNISVHHLGYGPFGTDSYWRQGRLNVVREFCKRVRDTGLLVAITSHRPEVFEIVESQNWDVDYYMCCLYKYGRTHKEWLAAFKSNPEMLPVEIGWPYEESDALSAPTRWSDLYGGEVAWVKGDPADMLKVVQQTNKPCFVYKLLADGHLTQRQDTVEAQFKYVLANIKKTDAVVVGMYDKYFDEYAINKEYVVKYSNTSMGNLS
jgi:hypothetical protein